MFRLLFERRVCGRDRITMHAVQYCNTSDENVQRKEARSAVHAQSHMTLLAAFASEASQPQTSPNTREQHLQLHVAAHARWLARSVSKHAPRLACSPQVQVYAGSAIMRPGHVRDASNNCPSETLPIITVPTMTPIEPSSWCAKFATRKATGMTT